MSIASALGDVVWGTPLYDYGSVAYRSAVEGYLRLNSHHRLELSETTATFRPSTFVEWNNLRHRIWDEERVLRHVVANVRPDDVFFDVGANIGIYSCLVGNRLTSGTVVSFEPYPPNVERLAVNLEANGVPNNVVTRPLSDGRHGRTFSVYDTTEPGAQHGSLDTDYPTGDPVRTFEVETVSGDRLVDNGVVPQPTVLKIDVQGTGPRVLDGLRGSLSDDRCRLVYVETHDNIDVLRDKLLDWGFQTETFRIDRPQKEPTLVASATV